MRAKAQPGEKSPNPIVYHMLIPPLRLYLFLRYGYRAPRKKRAAQDVSLPREGGFVVIGSHASNLDFLFTALAIYPHRPNVLVSDFFFGNAALAALLRGLRAIPRKQFRPDAASVRAMAKVARRGGCLLLYPEGEVNGTGRFYSMPPGIGRMCKMFGLPVYSAVTYGSYLSCPKWAKHERRGRVECSLRLAADAETLRRESAQALEARFAKALFYDDFRWQQEARVPFRGGRGGRRTRAERLENILYLCPRCQSEGMMASEGERFYCKACKNEARMDAYGFLKPLGAEDRIYESVADWSAAQREALRASVRREDFLLEAPGALLLHRGKRRLVGTEAGRGTLRLDRECLGYEGERLGERVSLRWPLTGFYKLSFGAGRDFDVPSADGPRVSLRPDNPQLVEKFVLAVDALREWREGGAI